MLLHGGTVAGVPFSCHKSPRRKASRKWRNFATCRGRALLLKFAPVQVQNAPSGAAKVTSLAGPRCKAERVGISLGGVLH